MNAEWMAQQVQAVVPDATVHATDLTGGGDHWHVVIVSDAFDGQRSFQRQRPVLVHFTPHIQSGVVHALDLKCMTPSEAAAGIPRPFVPHQAGEGMHPGAWPKD